MPVNEFEKQVQKLMDELKVAPSENVWPKVEERIRERKRRRGLIIFPLLIGLVLFGYLATSYFFSKNKTGIATENIQKENTQPVNSNIEGKQNPEIQQHLSQNQPANKKNTSESVVKADKFISSPYEGNTIVNEKKNEVASSTISNQDSNKNLNADKTIDVSEKDISQPIVADSAEKSGNITALTPIKKKNGSKKLFWGIQFSSGISAINDNLFSLARSQTMADYISAPSSVSGAPTRYAPSKTKTGFAFQIGPTIEKKISKRSTVSIGLLYSYYSNRIKVGTRRDSLILLSNSFSSMQSVSNYYQANPQSDFTNKYRFVELPVQYSARLNKGKSPITWDVGAMLSRLVSSKALAYDTANRGIYYDNHRLLKKNNIGISTGFSFGIVQKDKMRLTVGPHVRCSLTNFYKSDYDQNKFLLYGGIKFNLLFPAK